MSAHDLLIALKSGSSTTVRVRNESERNRVYREVMRLADATDPLQIHEHAPRSILHRSGARLTLRTSDEVLAELGPLPVCCIPAGEGWTGTDVQDPHHPLQRVFLPGYAMMTYPVTVRQFAVAVACGDLACPCDEKLWDDQLRTPDVPVTRVAMTDADSYVRWLRDLTQLPWRLPTEAEWEKAARGKDTRSYPWGDDPESTWAHVRIDGYIEEPASVLEYPENVSPWGVRHLIGNVAEMTETPYPGEPEYRIVKGGSFRQRLVTIGYRDGLVRYEGYSTMGLRLVHSL